MGEHDPWTWRKSVTRDEGAGLDGYRIQASDGSIGHVDDANSTVGSNWLLVTTGPWFLRRKFILPVGVIEHINFHGKVVHVALSREQVKATPGIDEVDMERLVHDAAYFTQLTAYYRTILG